MVDGNVYGIDLNSLDTKVLVEGLSDEAVAISESNRFLAWVDPSAVRGSDTIHMIDFSTEKVTDVTGSASDYVSRWALCRRILCMVWQNQPMSW